MTAHGRSLSTCVKNLGQNVARLRAARGLSFEALADRCGMSWRHIQKVEHGHNVTLKTLAKLADGLEVDPAELLARRRLVEERDAWREMAECLGEMARDRAQGLVRLGRFRQARQALIDLGFEPPRHPEYDPE